MAYRRFLLLDVEPLARKLRFELPLPGTEAGTAGGTLHNNGKPFRAFIGALRQ